LKSGFVKFLEVVPEWCAE